MSASVFFIFIYIVTYCCSILPHGCCVSPEFYPCVKWLVRYSTSTLQCSSHWFFFWITWMAPSNTLLLKHFDVSPRKIKTNLSGSPHLQWIMRPLSLLHTDCHSISGTATHNQRQESYNSHVSPPTSKYNKYLCRSPEQTNIPEILLRLFYCSWLQATEVRKRVVLCGFGANTDLLLLPHRWSALKGNGRASEENWKLFPQSFEGTTERVMKSHLHLYVDFAVLGKLEKFWVILHKYLPFKWNKISSGLKSHLNIRSLGNSNHSYQRCFTVSLDQLCCPLCKWKG